MKSFGKVKYRRYAFTLAEVLITITVIGVVAALTIPNLVNNYQNKAWSTASVVFQRKLGEALKVMNSQGTLAGYSSTEDFVNELSKHIKINKICKNDEITSCFEDTVFWGNDNEEVDMSTITMSIHLGLTGWATNTVAAQFGDGVTGVIAYNPRCTQDPYRTDVITISDAGIGTDCLAILYDTSGFKKPNTQSKDLRGLNVAALGGKPNCVLETTSGACFSQRFSAKYITPEECPELQNNGYPIPDCYSMNDSWGGAIKNCHDLGGSLPTPAQMDELATVLYGKPISPTSATMANPIYADINREIVSKLGTTSGNITTWSADGRYYNFLSDRTYRHSNSRQNGGTSICVFNN